MTWLKDLKIGDEVLLAPTTRRSTTRLLRVEKVGRKWVTLHGIEGRVDITQKLHNESARIDNGFGNVIYRSKGAYEAIVQARNLRSVVIDAVLRGALTDAQIADIATAIGISGREAS